jgi:hypothetical protein
VLSFTDETNHIIGNRQLTSRGHNLPIMLLGALLLPARHLAGNKSLLKEFSSFQQLEMPRMHPVLARFH